MFPSRALIGPAEVGLRKEFPRRLVRSHRPGLREAVCWFAWRYVALIVNVAVEEYDPVLTPVLSTRAQIAEPASPASAECASAPKLTTVVATEVLAAMLLLQGVPELGAVQV